MSTSYNRAAQDLPPPYTAYPSQTSTSQQQTNVPQSQQQYYNQSKSFDQVGATTQDIATPNSSQTSTYNYQISPNNRYEATRSSNNYNQAYSNYQPRQQTRVPPPGHPAYYPTGPHHPPPGHPPPPPPPPPRREPLCCVVV